MITLTREETQKVLDAFEQWKPAFECMGVVDLLRARLAQPEPKPSAWAVQEGINLHDVFLFKDEVDEMCYLKGAHAKAVPLYTAPPQRKEWQGLTDEEIRNIIGVTSADSDWNVTIVHKWICAIETKLRQKNGNL